MKRIIKEVQIKAGTITLQSWPCTGKYTYHESVSCIGVSAAGTSANTADRRVSKPTIFGVRVKSSKGP